jgi:chemotaxis-related protein WspD
MAKSLFDREASADEIRAWTEQLAGEKPGEPRQTVSMLMFRIRSEWLALPTQYFQEAVDLRAVHAVPFRSNRVFRGLVNVNGELLPCVSLVELLGLSGEDAQAAAASRKTRRRMVVLDKDKERFVFPVDEVLGVCQLCPDDVASAPSTVSKSPQALVRGVFQIEGKTIGCLDEERFYAALKGSLSS